MQVMSHAKGLRSSMTSLKTIVRSKFGGDHAKQDVIYMLRELEDSVSDFFKASNELATLVSPCFH